MSDSSETWFLVSIKAPWGRGYFSLDERTPWSAPTLQFGPQPVGVRGTHLERIQREFPTVHIEKITNLDLI